MIKLICIDGKHGKIYLNPEQFVSLEEQKESTYSRWWLRCGNDAGIEIPEASAKALIVQLEGDKPTTFLDDLVLTTLVSAERGETSNNQRPMWRCRTDDGEKVNIFLNTDEPEKDNYSLFKQAGWAEDLDAIRLYDTEEISIPVAMKKNGIWWEIVKVRTKPESNMPAWAMEGA